MLMLFFLIALAVISAVVAFGIRIGLDMMPLIVIYWLVLTGKNLLELAKRK